MKTFTQTKEVFMDAMNQLKRLEGPEKVTKALRTIKEREAGKLCYQAEEDLPQAELVLLKERLRVGNNTWERYKHIFLESMLKRK